ncbi:Adenine deaminase [Dissulfuribacter thermophilus]|uniref:Adenine deaminase n=1 Tax=Dissulfuribacter thermophilus TaxID=1156395 RepID=A0A1B9F8P2_9BACT|nr:adenine deaminase [Dissulfuribacter thermophilus]OCC16308.1 Adenine deaminase [Dissulfuribacter thermophilus]
MDIKELKRLIDVASGRTEADILLKGCRLLNVFTGEIYTTNIAISGKWVAGISENYSKAKIVKDCKSKFAIPGLIDSHIHIESTMLSPREFTRAVIPHGTTTVVIDPHEIANVCGIAGIEYMLEAGKALPLNFYVMAPSCVPATDLETSGAEIRSDDLVELLKDTNIHGLGELMNFPGVVFNVDDVIEKITAAHQRGVLIDGHAPGLNGLPLNAYICAGIYSDHECSSPEEALKKIRRGMNIFIREGSGARNLNELLKAITIENYSNFSFATDDRHPDDLKDNGHIDDILRRAVSLGLPPIWAVKMATVNAARNLGLKMRGAIAPGYFADIVLVEDLRNFEVCEVIINGKLVYSDGTIQCDLKEIDSSSVNHTINIGNFSQDLLKLEAVPDHKVNIIKVIEHQIVTEWMIDKPKVENELVVSDPERDIIKIAVIERHKATGNIGIGLIHGLSIKDGAIASSVAHDSHNIITAGTSDREMALAIEHLRSIGGGFTVVKGDTVLASCPLPIAGLMSEDSYEDVADRLEEVINASKEIGIKLSNPFMTLSFMALPVIPKLKITDRGLVDVERFKLIGLWTK